MPFTDNCTNNAKKRKDKKSMPFFFGLDFEINLLHLCLENNRDFKTNHIYELYLGFALTH